ncbi:hypothetical protein [Lacticaseibacillus nasuensis]|uniref:DUF3800 domain-containing protein n=1 Tax=Lacticaseibacillus nasuensis JCM 17158 TaxID=1291734 RepID=A0A0R1JT67_9LACO|nr:hypothetical protein [Lacticaseibacillus nasuensis]KRK74264.1 hypothetical protein FD02_GL000864 [Lacticaseibacillus nasuensis JCM 17158]
MENHLLFADEKGPQEHIKTQVSEKSSRKLDDPMRRFAMGSDMMTNYVMAVVDIPEAQLGEVEDEFLRNEKKYRKASHNFQGEIKGERLLKGKLFETGFTSMRDRELNFYLQTMQILKEHNAKVCIVTQNKVSSIITQRLHDWILISCKRMHVSFAIFTYILAKYFTLEAGVGVLEKCQEREISTYQLLKAIKFDLLNYLRSHSSSPRLVSQINSYKQILKVISKSLNINTQDSADNVGHFEWEKVDFSLELWLDERDGLRQDNSYHLFLDQGIKASSFNSNRFEKIQDGCHSDRMVGIRLADLIATITGRLMSELSLASLYDPSEPEKTIRLEEKWFSLTNGQFKLARSLTDLIINTGLHFSFNNDTYFDDAVHLQAYLAFISDFKSPDSLKLSKEKPEREFEIYAELAAAKFNQMRAMPNQIRTLFDGEQDAIDQGFLKPF